MAHSGGSMVCTSIHILGTYFCDTSFGTISENQAGAVTVFLSVGILVGLGVGGKQFATLSTDPSARKILVRRLYLLAVSMCYMLAILALPVVRRLLSPHPIAFLQAIATFGMGIGVAVQSNCIPPAVGATFGANKGLYFAYTDGVAYGVSSFVWKIVGNAVEEGSPQGTGWFYGWAAVALLVILAGLLMVEFVEHYFCRGGWKGRLDDLSGDRSSNVHTLGRHGYADDINTATSKGASHDISISTLFPGACNASNHLTIGAALFSSCATRHVIGDGALNMDDEGVSTIIFDDILNPSIVDYSKSCSNNSIQMNTGKSSRNSKDLKERLSCLIEQKKNETCVDCDNIYPRWISIIVPTSPKIFYNSESQEILPSLGCFCCTECSSFHRNLGTHIVFVRSVDHDTVKEIEVKSLESGGNLKVNSIYEAHLDDSLLKPVATSAAKIKEHFIIEKYAKRKWYNTLKPCNGDTLKTHVVSSNRLLHKGINFNNTLGLMNSIEMVRNVSVLNVDDESSKDGTIKEAINRSSQNIISSPKLHSCDAYEETSHLCDNKLSEEYESFLNNVNDLDSETDERESVIKNEMEHYSSYSTNDPQLLRNTEVNTNVKSGFSEIINL